MDGAADVSAQTAIGKAVIQNEQGLHMRPSGLFAKRAGEFESEVRLTADGQTVDGKSSMMLVLLGAPMGTELTIEAEGPDAAEAVRALVALVEDRFGMSATD